MGIARAMGYVALAAPGISVVASSSTSSTISLTSPSPNAVRYVIERSTNGTDFSPIATSLLASDFPHTDPALTTGTQYFYRVSAANETDTSPYSATVSVTPSASGLTTIFTDDFASGDLTKTTNGFVWGGSVGGAGASSNNAFSGTYALAFPYDPAQAWVQQYFNLGALYKHFVMEFDFYVDPALWNVTPEGANNNKFFRIWGSEPFSDASAPTNSYRSNEKVGASFYAYDGGYGEFFFIFGRQEPSWGPAGGPTDDTFITPGDHGTWMRIKMEIKMPTQYFAQDADSDGIMKMWKNGVLHIDKKLNNYDDSWTFDHAWQYGYLMGYANASYDAGTTFYIDNFSVSGVAK